ncbi:MAG: 23S rRNA (uracil(1939)-C(5))-methyltransferase RlmD [candidate division Zixibacteria bacterium]|nr:23S rRNA (uracil(1939)-C(5))-methyltransferase RlmD [candidate division Zixibacteria bacterium]
MSPKLVELEIIDLANEGKAVAHLDGKVCFLKGGLPGERVLAEITRRKPRYNEGVVREILKKSDQRIAAQCVHFNSCGGCTWQDLAYNSQLEFKRKHVVDCIERIGGLEEVRVGDIVPSKEVFYYRNKMEFSFHTGGTAGFTLGLHRRGHFDEIFDVEQCLLQSELSNRLITWFRKYATGENIPVYDVKEHVGYLRFLMIREGKNTGQTMVNIVTNYGDFPDEEKMIGALNAAIPEVTTVVHNQNGKKSNIAAGEIEKVLYGPGYIEETLSDFKFRIRANSFFQTNPRQAEVLYETAFDLLQPGNDDRLLDLYCGAGSIGILASRRVAEVAGVELVGEAVRAARENAALNDIENINFHEGDVKDFLNRTEVDNNIFNIICIDPPRAGLHPKALKRLALLKPEKILYISCNPATFARDAAALVEAGYCLPEVIPVDMFPHTTHVELTGIFYAR